MPFCTECGQRHADTDTQCPKCGAAIAVAPGDDLDDLVDAMTALTTDEPVATETPGAGLGSEYLEQIQEVRGQISAQSSALRGLSDLSGANPEANAIRDQLGAALDRLHALTPPDELAAAHTDFVEGAELLANGFAALVKATEHPGAEGDRGSAESSIAEATGRFLRGANAINDYLVAHGFDTSDEDEQATAEDAPTSALPEVSLDELDRLMGPDPAAEAADAEEDLAFGLPSAPAGEIEDLAAGLPMAPEPPEPAPLDDDFPPMPPELADLPSEPPDAAPAVPTPAVPGSTFLAAPAPSTLAAMPAPTTAELEAWGSGEAAAWAAIGDPATDSLLLEIEGGWVRGRPMVHDAIERAVRAAVADALRNALATRLRIEQEARAALSRISGERTRMLHEVDALRGEAHGLQAEAAELRRTINELERERQLSQDRRQQMFHDAEAQRNQLLREIEQLGGQLESMRQNIVSLLGMSAGASAIASELIAEHSGLERAADPSLR